MSEKQLFLTSCGLSSDMKKKFFNVIGKRPEEIKILYIPTAGNMYAAGNLDAELHIINNPIVPPWNGTKLVEVPSGRSEIPLVDGQAVYISGDYSSLI